MRLPAVNATLLVCTLLSGCGAIAVTSQTENAADGTDASAKESKQYQPDPVLLFVGSAKDNEKGRVLDPATGKEVQVIAGRTYNAASGRLCRRYRIFSPAESSAHAPELACRDHLDRWQKIPPLLNLDNSRISTIPK